MKKQLAVALMLSAIVLTACEEDLDIPAWKNDGGAKPISITSFYPETGEIGSTVTIFLENFAAPMTDTYVTFNGLDSKVLQVQPGKITVRVPLNLSQGNCQLAVSAQGQTATSEKVFYLAKSDKS